MSVGEVHCSLTGLLSAQQLSSGRSSVRHCGGAVETTTSPRSKHASSLQTLLARARLTPRPRRITRRAYTQSRSAPLSVFCHRVATSMQQRLVPSCRATSALTHRHPPDRPARPPSPPPRPPPRISAPGALARAALQAQPPQHPDVAVWDVAPPRRSSAAYEQLSTAAETTAEANRAYRCSAEWPQQTIGTP
jgi:hypothetical protein